MSQKFGTVRNNKSGTRVDASAYKVSAVAKKQIATPVRTQMSAKRAQPVRSSQMVQGRANSKIAKAQAEPRRVQNGMTVSAPANSMRRQFVNQLKATNPRLSVKSALPITKCSNGGCGSLGSCDSCGNSGSGSCDSCGSSGSCNSGGCSNSACEKYGTRCDPISFGNQSFCDIYLGCAQAIPLLFEGDSIPVVGSYPIVGGAVDQALGDFAAGNGIQYIAANSTSTCSGLVIPSGMAAAPAGWDYEDGTITFPVVQNGCSASVTRFFFVQDTCEPANSALVSRTVCWTVDANPPMLTVVNWQGQVYTGSGTAEDPFVISLGCQNYLQNGNGQTTATSILQSLVVTATDPCACNGLDVSLAIGPVSDADCGRSIEGTWSAIGTCETGYLYVEITWIDDTVAPIITLGSYPGHEGDYITDLRCYLNGDPSSEVIDWALGTASATDGCGGQVDLTVSTGEVVISDCGKSVTRYWYAVDQCGNESSDYRTIAWIDDTSNPIIVITSSCHEGPVTQTPEGACDLGCNPCARDIDLALGFSQADFKDACGLNVDVTCDPGTPWQSEDPNDACRWYQTRTWTATNYCDGLPVSNSGLSITVSWIENTTPPTITIQGYTSGDVIQLFNQCNPEDEGASVLNGVEVSVSVSPCNPDSDNVHVTTDYNDEFLDIDNCTKQRTRTWRAEDTCGNVSFATLTVEYTVSSPITIVTRGVPMGSPVNPGNANLSYDVNLHICNPSEEDIQAALGEYFLLGGECSGAVVNHSDTTEPSDGCKSNRTRTWTVTSNCGDSIEVHRTVYWIESAAPVLTVAETKDVDCCAFSFATSFDEPDIVNSCGNQKADGTSTPPVYTYVDSTIKNNDGTVTHTRTWTYTNGCGDSDTKSQTITVASCGASTCLLANGINRRPVLSARQKVQQQFPVARAETHQEKVRALQCKAGNKFMCSNRK